MTSDGRHAPMAAPGDLLMPDGTLRPGPHHVDPPCRHFSRCGGCQLQHLDLETEAGFVRERVAGVLAAQGIETEIRAPILSPPQTRRRATLHAERRGRQVLLGFTEQASHHLIDLQQCEILDPRLFALLNPLRGLLATLLPRSTRADVHLTLADQGVDVVLKGVKVEGLASAEGLTAFARRHGLARLSIDEGFGAEPRWEPEPVTITLGGVPVPLPPAAFLQATPEGEAALVAAVRETVGDAGIIADLFAGLGTFALSLPGRVYAAEAARDAAAALKSAADRTRRQLFVDHRDLYRRPLTAEEANRFDAIVLDPPRAGAKEQVTGLAASTVPVIAYVSCNPSSFAKDAAILCETGYRLDWVQPVGQFRWSTHVELASRFSR